MPQDTSIINHPVMDLWQRAMLERNWCVFGIEKPNRKTGKRNKWPTDHVGAMYEYDRVHFDSPVSVHDAARYTYEEVMALIAELEPRGRAVEYKVGYLPRPDSVLTAGDLDHCRDPQTGVIEDWAMDILRAGHTYAEVSTSGTGVRILMGRQEGDDQQTHREKNNAGYFANGKLAAVLTFEPISGFQVLPQNAPAVRNAILMRRGHIAPEGEAKSSVVTDPVPFDLVRAMLIQLPNDDAPNGQTQQRGLVFDDFLRVGMSVKAALGAQGRDLFHWWASQSAKYDATDCERKWRSFDPREITFGKLAHMVKEAHGGKYPPELAAMMTARWEQRMKPFDPWEDIPDFPDAPWMLSVAAQVVSVVDVAQLTGLVPKAREWTVNELVPRKSVTLLTGDGGVGKSLIALQLAASVAVGRPWLGQRTAHGNALYVSAEDDMDELHRRITSICAGHGVQMQTVTNMRLWSLAGQDAVMATAGLDNIVQSTALFDLVRKQAEAVQPEIIVLDTLADLFAGNESDRSHVTQFINMLIGLALDFNCAVVLLAHPSKSGQATGDGTSGSTAWHNKVRSRLYLTREQSEEGMEPDPRRRVLQHMKANYASDDHQITMRWDRGMFHLVGAQELPENNEAMIEWEVEFLRCLDERNRQGRHVGSSKSVIYAPAVFIKMENPKSIKKGQYELAMESLFSKGVIEMREIRNSDSKSRSYIFRSDN